LKKETILGSISYFVGDAATVNLSENYFDAILCHGSLHHLGKLEEILDKVYGLLKPAGVLIAFEHRELDPRLKGFFPKMDDYMGWFWSKKRVCKLLDIIFMRAKKIVDHPIRPEGGSPMEGVSAADMEGALENSQFNCIKKALFSPFAFNFVERYATVYDWRKPFKVPSLVLLKFIDLFLEKVGFKGELIFWVGEKKGNSV